MSNLVVRACLGSILVAAVSTTALADPQAPVATRKGIWGLVPSHAERAHNDGPTRADVVKKLGLKSAPPFDSVDRGDGQKAFAVERDGVRVTFVYPKNTRAPVLWFETQSDGVCVDGVCVGDSLAKAAKQPGFPTVEHCIGSADGQGFNGTWTCVDTHSAMNIWLQAKDAQGFQPPSDTVDLHELIAADARVIGFIWQAKTTWAAERYDEGDR